MNTTLNCRLTDREVRRKMHISPAQEMASVHSLLSLLGFTDAGGPPATVSGSGNSNTKGATSGASCPANAAPAKKKDRKRHRNRDLDDGAAAGSTDGAPRVSVQQTTDALRVPVPNADGSPAPARALAVDSNSDAAVPPTVAAPPAPSAATSTTGTAGPSSAPSTVPSSKKQKHRGDKAAGRGGAVGVATGASVSASIPASATATAAVAPAVYTPSTWSSLGPREVVERVIAAAGGDTMSRQALNVAMSKLGKPVLLDVVKGQYLAARARVCARGNRNPLARAAGDEHHTGVRYPKLGTLGLTWDALAPVRQCWLGYALEVAAGGGAAAAAAGGGAAGGAAAAAAAAGGGGGGGGGANDLSTDARMAKRVQDMDLHGCPVKGTRVSALVIVCLFVTCCSRE